MMPLRDKLDITLRIGDVTLSLTISPEEEAMLRQVAKEVNHAYSAYESRFQGSPANEILAKVTLLFAKGYLNLSAQAKRTEAILGDFEHQLDEILLETNPEASSSGV